MEGLETVLKEGEGRTFIDIQVSTNSRETAITGIDPWRARMNMDVREKPISGKANREIVQFFAELFGVPSRDVTITAGGRSRQKTLAVDLPKERVEQILMDFI